MNLRLLFSTLVIFPLLATAGDLDIRTAYHQIPIKYLPITQVFLEKEGKADNHENRDLVLTYHNEKIEFIKLKYKDSPLLGRLRMFSGGGSHYIVIEHTYCRAENCENHFAVLRHENGSYVEVSAEVIKGFDIKVSKIRGDIKKAFKDSYGDLTYYDELEYDNDEALAKNLFWQMDDLNGTIYLKESSLPHIIASYKWNASKARFDQL